MGELLPPMLISFTATAKEDQEAPIGRLFHFPAKVKVTAVAVELAKPLNTAEVKLSGNLWAFDVNISEYLTGGPRKFLNGIGPAEVLRAADNRVPFGDTQLESNETISVFSITGKTAGNVFVMDVALGKYAPATVVRGRLSVRLESIDGG